MTSNDSRVHLLAGGLAGTAGAVVTCPLEVVKTRLQSSVATFHVGYVQTSVPGSLQLQMCNPLGQPQEHLAASKQSFGIWGCIRHIVKTEGAKALFKGLGPNLVGVAPTRAIFFYTYSNSKCFFNGILTPDTSWVHVLSSATAGFTSCSITSPIWVVKTRLQLDQRKYGSTTTAHCIRNIFRVNGAKGFYKGITASYIGISETILNFLMYELIKARIREYHQQNFYNSHTESPQYFMGLMCASAVSKTCASIITYPHEVIRTRLRQEGDKYRSFFQTLLLVYKEEGKQGLYRGLGTQLVRQIPNAGIMMVTYELVSSLMTSVPCNMPAVQFVRDEEEEATC